MAIKMQKSAGRVSSPVSCPKATNVEIAKVKEVLDRHTKGLTIGYEPDWVGRAYHGAISTTALFRYYAGDKSLAMQEGMQSGVYRWHNANLRQKLNAPDQPLPLGRFTGMDDLNEFLKAKPEEQDKFLRAKSIVQ